MTLKNLSSDQANVPAKPQKLIDFKLIWDTVRKNLWIPTIYGLAFFFALPVATALRLKDTMSTSNTPEQLASSILNVQNILHQTFSSQNIFLIVILIIGALIAGLSIFAYLHSKKRIDFYHSLPVKREKLFLTNYLTGILVIFMPYLFNLILTLIVVAANGYGDYLSVATVFAGIGVHLLGYLAIFSATVLAVMLTGNIVVSGIILALILGIGPALIGLYQATMEIFYNYFYSMFHSLNTAMIYSSPIASYGVLESSQTYPWVILMLAIYAVAFFAAAFLLYRKRGSEAAAHAVAFRVAKPIIKYPTILLFTMAGGYFFHGVGGSSFGGTQNPVDFWLIFGFVCGALISSRIIEIVYQFDFKAIRKNFKGLLIYGILFAALISVPALDLTKYDQYLPQTQQVAQVNVQFDSLNSFAKNYNYYTYVDGGDYWSRSKEALMQNAIRDPQNIAALIQIVETSKQYFESDQMGTSNTGKSTGIGIVYTLANGKQIARYYSYVPISLIQDDLSQLLDSEEFKLNQYGPILQMDPERILIAGVATYANDQSYQPLLEIAPEKRLALIKAYQSDLMTLSSNELKSTLPIGSIEFHVYSTAQGFRLTETGPDGNITYKENYYTITYPIYPSFSNTFAALANSNLGASFFTDDPAKVLAIKVYRDSLVDIEQQYAGDAISVEEYKAYREKYETSQMSMTQLAETITDPPKIAQLLTKIYADQAFNYNDFFSPDYSVNYVLTVKTDLDPVDISRYAIAQ